MPDPQGLVVLSAPDHSKPWLITGSGRSGTSALAKLCGALGLDLLTLGPNPTEHRTMRRALAAGDWAAMSEFRRGWTSGQVVKTPGLGVVAASSPEVATLLDCNYLISFRDPVTEAFYDTHQHPEANVGELMRTRAKMAEQGVSGAIALSQSYGVLVMSYEKLIQPRSNRSVVQHLCTLIGGQPERVDAALAVLQPEEDEYRARAFEDLPGVREARG